MKKLAIKLACKITRGVRIVSIFTIFFTSVCSAENIYNWKLSPDGLGPIHIGMTLQEVEKITHKNFIQSVPDTSAGENVVCFNTELKDKNLDGVTFVISNGKIVRINVLSNHFLTSRGARIGDTEAQVQQLYNGKLKVEPHFYVEKGHYLTYCEKPKDRAIRFETDGKKIALMYVGRNKEVQQVEDCF